MRRAGLTFATGLLVAGVALPGLLISGQPPASASPAAAASTATLASTAKSDTVTAPVSVAITRISPRYASPGRTITVTGIVINNSKQPVSHLTVQLLSSTVAFGSVASLQLDLTTGGAPGVDPVKGKAVQPPASPLNPGARSKWSVSFKADKLGLTGFGVYPLTAQVQGPAGVLDRENTVLPYEPSRRGPDAKTRPAPEQIAWAWPLIDSPLTPVPGRLGCRLAAARPLGMSMAPGGRLAGLLSAGALYAAKDRLTWAVDPAVLSAADDLAQCTGLGAATTGAKTWLAAVRKDTAGQPLFVTSYGNVNLSLLQSHPQDVTNAYTYGRQTAGTVLNRDVGQSTARKLTGASLETAGIEWPPDGKLGYYTMLSLAASDHVGTLLLADTAVTASSGTTFKISNGVGGQAAVLLYSSSLTQTLQAANSAPGSTFAASQDFLAQTALLAAARPSAPIVVAPPQYWKPPAGLADAVLADTADAPWLKPATLSAVASHAATAGSSLLPSNYAGGTRISRPVRRQLLAVDQLISELEQIQADPGSQSAVNLYLAVAALESSSWHSSLRPEQLGQLAKLRTYLEVQQQAVRIVTPRRVTLGGLKGSVPVVIDNRLDYAITVQLHRSVTAPPSGVIVTQDPTGPVSVGPGQEKTIRLHVQAAEVGTTLITVRLLNRNGAALPGSAVQVSVQATEFGNIAMIILAAVLGLFTLASAIRGIRRGRPAPPDNGGEAGQAEAGHPDEDAAQGGQDAPGPDTVVPERSELGAAGTSGL